MKKVSELVDLRNQLQNTMLEKTIQQFSQYLLPVQKYLYMTEAEFGVEHDILTQNIVEVFEKCDDIDMQFSKYIEKLNTIIRNNDGNLRKISEETSKESTNNADNNILEKIKIRESTHVEDTIQYFSERCKLYSSWKFPGMQIRPGVGTWTKNIVDSDPLYLVDIDFRLLESIKNVFNEHYVNRLRFNKISDVDKPIFKDIPQNQFGFVLITEFFNQKSLNVIEQYLKEIKNLLRPGGVCIFTFNDCDYKEGVINAEHGYDCYTPRREIKDIVLRIGFEIIESFSSYGTLHWMEIKNPGELHSVRGGQPLAKVLNKTK